MELKIKNLAGDTVVVENLNKAITECRSNMKSPYKMVSGHTIGEDHAYMLAQLLQLKNERKKA